MATILECEVTSACDRVFAIRELVESILTQLDLRTLLLSQLVSRQWRDIIESSQTIQQNLFFTAPKNLDRRPEHNPLLKALFQPFFAGRPPMGQDDSDCLFDPRVLLSSDWYTDETKRNQVLREEASWRRMFPITPPSPITVLRDASTCGCWTDDAVGTVKEGLQDPSTGCTMGLLYDIVIDLIDAGSSGGVFIDWCQMFEPEYDEVEDGESDEEINYIRRDDPTEWDWSKREVEIYVEWQRECYAKKGEAITGLEIVNRERKKRLWNVKWRRGDDASKKN